jgi:hypothetical protein
MSKTKFLVAAIALFGLAGLSLYLNRDWFSDRPIHISHRVNPWAARVPRGRRVAPPDPGNPVAFNFDPLCRFSSIKVFITAELETNKYARPLWELVSDSNSIPIGALAYGARVPGMRPAVKGATADPLQPGVVYRLVVKTDGKQLQHDFVTTPKP